MKFGKRIKNRFMPQRREAETTGNSGLVAPDERSALLYMDADPLLAGESDTPVNAPLQAMRAPEEMPTGADPTQRMLTALGRFHIYVTKGQAGVPHTMWADECMTQLAFAIEVSLAQQWSNLVEALTDTARILHSYENGGHAPLCVPFLNDSYEILCLMVGDLIVDNIRPDVMDRWRARYARALKDLNALGIQLVLDEDEDEPAIDEAPAREANVIPFELPASRVAPARQEEPGSAQGDSYLPFLRAADEDEEGDDEPVADSVTEEPVIAPVFEPVSTMSTPEPEVELPPPFILAEKVEEEAVPLFETRVEEIPEPVAVVVEEPVMPEAAPVAEAAVTPAVTITESLPEQADLMAAFDMETPDEPTPVSIPVEAEQPIDETPVDASSDEKGIEENAIEEEPAFTEAMTHLATIAPVNPEPRPVEANPVDVATLAMLDSLSEDLAAIEQNPEAEHGPRWESMREKVSALEARATERNLVAAPSICRTMMDLCRAAARRGVDGFVDTAYLFCEAYVQADRNPDSVVVKNWYAESAALLQAWTEPVTESADPTGRLLDTARTAMARGDLSGAKALALQAVALMAKGEAERAEARVQESELRLKQSTEAIDQARAAVAKAEQDVAVAESRVSEGGIAVNEAQELVGAFQNKMSEATLRIAALDEEIRRLQARRATEEEQAHAIENDLLRARQNEESVKKDLESLVKAENGSRTRLEDARQSVKDQQRRRSEQETALMRCRETLTRHRTSLSDIERAVTQVGEQNEASTEDANGMLFE